MKKYKFLLLGSGVAAGYAAKELVQRNVEPGSVGIVTADDILLENASFYDDHGIELRLNQPVVGIDFDTKTVECKPGGEVRYEQLLITTGSKVRHLETPGAGLGEIYYLRSLDDAQRLRDRIARGGRAAVIGSGFIGMEVASVMARKGVEPTMIFPEERVWKKFFTPELSAFFQKYFADRGVKF